MFAILQGCFGYRKEIQVSDYHDKPKILERSVSKTLFTVPITAPCNELVDIMKVERISCVSLGP